MKNRSLQAIPLILLCQSALAHDVSLRESTPYNFYANPYLVVEHFDEQSECSTSLRMGYLNSSIGSPKRLSSSALGGKLDCRLSVNNHLKTHLVLWGSMDTGLNHADDDQVHGDFFNDEKEGYLLLGEVHLILSFDTFEAHLGRQQLDTPHMNNDDLRIIPNLFEAYLIEFHLADNLHAGMGFVRTMAGWENGADQSHFKKIGDAFGGDGSQAWLTWLRQENEQFSYTGWYYRIPDHLHILYGDITHHGHLDSNSLYSLSAQYDWGEAIGDHKLGDIEAKTWGAAASLSIQQLTVTLAYNKNNSRLAALPSLGGGAFFTSMEDQTLDAITGEEAEAVLMGLEYAAAENLTLGAALGQFNAKERNDYDVEELDLYLSYSWKAQTTFDLTYARVDNKNSSGIDHQFRAILAHSY